METVVAVGPLRAEAAVDTAAAAARTREASQGFEEEGAHRHQSTLAADDVLAIREAEATVWPTQDRRADRSMAYVAAAVDLGKESDVQSKAAADFDSSRNPSARLGEAVEAGDSGIQSQLQVLLLEAKEAARRESPTRRRAGAEALVDRPGAASIPD